MCNLLIELPSYVILEIVKYLSEMQELEIGINMTHIKQLAM